MQKIKFKKNWLVKFFDGILNTIFWMFNAWRRLIETMERTLVNNVAATVPWAAPVPSAYMLFDHALKVLLWDRWVAWVLAIAVEGLGVSVASTAFDLWNWNDRNKDSEQKSSLKVAIATVTFYLFIVIMVNVLLDLDFPVWIAKAGISMLSVPAVVTLALRSQHSRRVEKAAADEDQRVKDEARNVEQQENERELEFKRQERSKDREFKRQLKLKEVVSSAPDGNSQKVSVKVAESDNERSANFGKYRGWRNLPEEERLKVFQMRNDVRLVMKEYGVIERTGYNWIGNAEREFIGKLEREAL